ncbi:hypothetical protein RRG08_009294 [Elysia crispata]|uniref:Leucine-rich repeat-containing protein 14 n=1 Tax=Elysia crispata TaxID=231223 RepID=A0AAE1DKD9_9GAST|nr:hypothetical protein RRG08_009294 [Elysia crispata]
MAMTDAMEDVNYDTVDFNQWEYSENNFDSYDASLRRHPSYMTEGHYVYHLYRDDDGKLAFVKDSNGEALCSPRPLQHLCQYLVVTAPERLEYLKLHTLPCDLYPCLMSEAILQRQLKTVSFLVATWPFHLLHVQSVIPKEELLGDDFLTVPLEDGECMSLLDGIALGLLNRRPHCKLTCLNLTGFRHDRRLCKEVLRFPIVWMKPSERQSGYLHSTLRKILEISKEKVQRYLNRISCIYSNLDLLVRHGHQFGPVTIVLDCKLTVDDVPIGLALQGHTPFRYVCQKAWLEVLQDVCLPVSVLSKVLEPKYLTHIEVEDSQVCSDLTRWKDLLNGLSTLQELSCLSLPNSVHVTLMPTAAVHIGRLLGCFKNLKKLSLSSCTLRDCLETLLQHLKGPLLYLNLRDCRLSSDDLRALLMWQGLATLRELNLSRNSLGALSSLITCLLERMEHIACFSVSYCSLPLEAVRDIVRHCMDCSSLKVLCVQSFIPPPLHELRGILEDCANIPTLQKCLLLPEAYAFPGTHISQRADNHGRTVLQCAHYLYQLGRSDIEIE